MKHHKTAIYGHNRTFTSQDFVSMALLQYSAHPYGTIFYMAIAVYGMAVSPKQLEASSNYSQLWLEEMNVTLQTTMQAVIRVSSTICRHYFTSC
jgi:hypothetical protein